MHTHFPLFRSLRSQALLPVYRKGVKVAWETVREKVAHLDKDRPLHVDHNALMKLVTAKSTPAHSDPCLALQVKSGAILERVEASVGSLC